ncbi:unnamed protein product [Durusdinium trenchii]|uniref:Uncharacterized protein n=2 Tax=Durusdinium trenchii TaxID=1381693 RepID=A0ABP0QSJ8_9DINO
MALHAAVLPGLFICDAEGAKEYSTLRSCGISHVVVMARSLQPEFPGSFQYLQVDLLDDGTDDLLAHLPRIFSFLDNAFQRQGKVLVHCFAGMSRSASTVIAYVMRQWQLPFDLAFGMLKEMYPKAAPAANFCEQLRVFEEAHFSLADEEGSQVLPQVPLGSAHRRNQEQLAADEQMGDLVTRAGDETKLRACCCDMSKSSDKTPAEDCNADVAQGAGSYGFWQKALVQLYIQEGTSTIIAEKKMLAAWALSHEPSWHLYVQEWKKSSFKTVDLHIASALRQEFVRTAHKDVGEAGESRDGQGPAFVYCCIKCREALFTSDHVLHDCASGYYVEPMQWMMTSAAQGKLACACGAKLGGFTWNGQMCMCGTLMAPAFSIHKKKVEWKSVDQFSGDTPKPKFG